MKTIDVEKSFNNIRYNNLKWVVRQRKHAERIQRTLNSLTTSNTHDLNLHIINVRYWFKYYNETKETSSEPKFASRMWSKIKMLEHILRNAESFIYRIVNGIPTK